MATIPPSYADLGKSGRDLFSKGFNYGFCKLDTKTKTQNGMEFKTATNSNHDSGKFNGNFEGKYTWKDYGLTLTEKFCTDDTLGAEVTVEDKILAGLKLSFDTVFAPKTGKKSGKIKTEYKREYIHTNCDLDFDFAGPTIHGAFVIGYKGWLGGYQMVFDSAKSKLSQSNFAVGYSKDDFTFHGAVNDGSEFQGNVYQKISEKFEGGVQLNWAAGTNGTRFGLAGKYVPQDGTTFRGKVYNNCQVGLSLQQKIRDGLTFTLSTLVEGKTFNQGGHKVGIGLEFEA